MQKYHNYNLNYLIAYLKIRFVARSGVNTNFIVISVFFVSVRLLTIDGVRKSN